MSEIQPPDVGEVAPDFTTSDMNGQGRRLSDLCAERSLVLVFYRGHW